MRLYGIMLLSMLVVSGLTVSGTAFAADDGASVFSESCMPCHSPKARLLDNTHLTREQWKAEVDRMMDQGAEVPKKKLSELLDYLVNTHGPAGVAAGGAGK